MRPGDRLVCAFIKQMAAGDAFKTWPLHVTVVPWFRVSGDIDQLKAALGDALSRFRPFQAIIGDEALFGHGKTVNLVSLPSEFIELEEAVRDLLKTREAWLVDETTQQQRDYQPHVTVQNDDRLYTGDTFICDALYVVEQEGDHKQVVARIGVGDEATA